MISELKQLRKAGVQRVLWTGCLLGLCAVSGSAQTAKPPAIEIARKVDQHYNQLHTLKASFSEQFDGLGMHRSESGTLLLQKPGRMRWNYASSPGKLFLLDGKYAWFYAPGQTQVQRIAASQLDDLRSPLRFLLGHTKIENELEGIKLEAGRAGETILSGIPKGQQKRIARMALTIGPGNVMQGIEIQELDGATTRFVFSLEEPNAAIPESEFHFTPPAGIPVVDSLPPV